jgi:hypothetical protein
MEHRRHNSLTRLLPSLTDAMFLMPALFLFLRMDGAPRMIEGDTGWHLRTGEWILRHGMVPRADMFSFTRPGEPWFAWEWLWDVTFGWMYQNWGMTPVVWVSLVLLCLMAALTFRLVLSKCPSRLLAAVVTFLAVAASSLHWWARPHVVTLLFTVISLGIVEWHARGEKKLLWTLPLLTIPWVNLHGGFLVVLLILGSYAAGELIAAALAISAENRKQHLRAFVPYAGTGAFCLAASLINPYTYHLHGHIFRYLGDSESPFFKFVGEWQSVSFRAPVARYLEVLIVLMVIAGVQHLRKRRYAYPVLMAGWMHLALMSARNIPIFALVCAPFIAQAIYELLGEISEAPMPAWWKRVSSAFSEIEEEFGGIDRLPRVYLVSAASLAAVLMLMLSPGTSERFQAEFPYESYPRKAVDALPVSEFTGNLFTSDEWGDYLIYRHPEQVKVFVDGRFDFYGAGHTQDYLDVMNAKFNWEEKLAKHSVQSVLLPVGAPLSSVLKESARWTAVYDDGVSILFHSRRLLAARKSEPTSSAATAEGTTKTPAISPKIGGFVPAIILKERREPL